MIDFLKEKHVDSDTIRGTEGFRANYPADAGDQERTPAFKCQHYGREIREWVAAALLCGQNLLLAGPRAMGKSILAEGLAAASGHPLWDISFHANMDGAVLIGADTFEDNRVAFRPGPVSCCGVSDGFGVLDEVNMVRNEAPAVFYSTLDFRRAIDVSGYNEIRLREETRFITTMNYGYAGARESNEALASWFMVINMPVISQDSLERLLRAQSPRLGDKYARQFALLFQETRVRCQSGETSTKPLDLRGLPSALGLMEMEVGAYQAPDIGITNKSPDPYEQTLIRDMIRSRIPKGLDGEKLFSERIRGRTSA